MIRRRGTTSENYRYSLEIAKSLYVYGFILSSTLILTNVKLGIIEELGFNLSPIYFWFITGGLLFTIAYLPSHIKVDVITCFTFFIIIYFGLTQIFLHPPFSLYLIVIISFYYMIATRILCSKTPSSKLRKIAIIFVYSSTILVLIETVIRIEGISLIEGLSALVLGDSLFYKFKTNSIMFPDSNYTAFLLLSIIPLSNAVLTKLSRLFFLSLQSVLIIMTFSRSAIVAFFLVVVLSLIMYKIKFKSIIFVFIFFFVVVLSIYPMLVNNVLYYFGFVNDASFTVKMGTFLNAYKFHEKTDFINFLTGIGFGNSPEYLSIGGHSFFITYLIETGILGVTLMYIYITLLYTNGSKNTLYLILLLLITGASFVSHFIPYFFVIYNLLYYIEKNDKTVVAY